MADKKISQLTDGNPAQSNDQIPISRAGANFRITPGSIVNLGVASLTGTANQVIASAATGAVTLSLPQSIAASSTVSFAGMSLSGNLSMGSNYITNLAVPQNANDAANKTYVDQVAEGLRTKSSDQVATTADLNATYNNGALGVGATLISNVNGPFPTIDGVSGLGVGAQILVKNQTNAAENGTYSLTTQGTAGTPWVLTRDPSTDTASEIPGSYIFVTGGTLYAGTGWVLTVANASTFVVGTDAITVSQFSGAGAYSAGTGLVLVGTQFSTTGQVLALANLSTNGLIARTASNTLAARTLTASTGISIADGDGVSGNPTITNTAPDQVVTLSSGTGISTSGTYPSFTITNTAPDQVVTLSSGTGISTSGSYPSFTITNTAPDQTVVLSAGTGISTSGTYPSFTITNSDPGSSQNIFKNIAVAGQSTIIADSNNDTLTVASGTGISLTTNDSTDTLTITNNAPDQTVVLSSGTGISVTGTYPNFTVAVSSSVVTTTGAQTVTDKTLADTIFSYDNKETVTVSGTGLASTINLDVLTSQILYSNANATGNWTLNVRGSSGTTLNSLMANGQSITVTVLAQQGATPYYNNVFQIDGNAVTPEWQGGTAPTSGNANGIDVYVYAIIKTASATFTVLASQTQFT